MKCKHCGSYMENDAPYCQKCGMKENEISTKELKIAKLDKQVENHVIKKNKGNNPILVVIIIIVLIPTVYLFYTLYKTLTETGEEIEYNRKENATQSAIAAIEAGKKFATETMLSNPEGLNTSRTFICNGKTCSATINGQKVKLVIQGLVPSSGRITVDTNGDARITEDLVIDEFICKQIKNQEVTCEKK